MCLTMSPYMSDSVILVILVIFIYYCSIYKYFELAIIFRFVILLKVLDSITIYYSYFFILFLDFIFFSFHFL